jgi:hypothetical protein
MPWHTEAASVPAALASEGFIAAARIAEAMWAAALGWVSA